jgi:hypothetical protein
MSKKKPVSVMATTSFVAEVDGKDVHFIPDTPYELSPDIVARFPHLFINTEDWMKGKKPA